MMQSADLPVDISHIADQFAAKIGRVNADKLSEAEQAAFIVVLFLHYLEDNDKNLGLDFDHKKFGCDVLAKVFGTAYFSQSEFSEGLEALLDKLSIPKRPFRELLSLIAEGATKEAFEAFRDLELGALTEDIPTLAHSGHNPYKWGHCINEALRTTPGFRSSSGTTSLYNDSALCARLLEAEIDSRELNDFGFDESAVITVCDPLCGRGGFLVLLQENNPVRYNFTWYDISPICCCITAIRLFFAGYRGPYAMKVQDSLSEAAPHADKFDFVLAETSRQSGAYRKAQKGMAIFDPDARDRELLIRQPEALTALQVMKMLKPQGMGILRLGSNFASGLGDFRVARKALLRHGWIYACFEFRSGSTRIPNIRTDGGVILVLKKDQNKETLLGNISGRGSQAPDKEHTVYSPYAKHEMPFVSDVVNSIMARQTAPFEIDLVSYEEIIANETNSFRLADYREVVDTASKIANSPSLETAVEKLQEIDAKIVKSHDHLIALLENN